jgi:hypothetical protein
MTAQPGRTWQRRFRRPRQQPSRPAAAQQAAASWSGASTMTILGHEGPGLAALWAAYLQAKQAAIEARQALDMARGAYNTDGWGYVMAAQFYVADRAADQAYQAWAVASEYWQRELGVFAASGGGQ